MGLLDRLLGTRCDVCGKRFSGEPHVLSGRKLCAPCNEVAATRRADAPDEADAVPNDGDRK